MQLDLSINGEKKTVDVEPDTPLLWVLRDELKLIGTKFGCGVAQCGACTVHVNGKPVRSCVMAASWVGEGEITTIEGVSGPEATAVQEAWEGLQVPQCGYCQSGQMMTAIALLKEVPNPTDEQIDSAMTGNICRCATYGRIRQAIQDAAKTAGGGS